MLSLIEWRWSLAPLSMRDATANNLAHVLDFTRPKDLTAPQFDVPVGPFGEMCEPAGSATRVELQGLRYMALRYGFPVPR